MADEKDWGRLGPPDTSEPTPEEIAEAGPDSANKSGAWWSVYRSKRADGVDVARARRSADGGEESERKRIEDPEKWEADLDRERAEQPAHKVITVSGTPGQAGLAGDIYEAYGGVANPGARVEEWYSPEQQRMKAAEDALTAQAGTAEADPMFAQAQAEALQELQDIYRQGGLTEADRARLEDIAGQQRRVERGQREAVMQQMQARGMGGSGAELQALLGGQQAAQMQAGQRAGQAARAAEARALQAMQATGQLAGQGRGQSFSEQFQTKEAIDRMNKWNQARADRMAASTPQTRDEFYAGTEAARETEAQKGAAMGMGETILDTALAAYTGGGSLGMTGGIGGGGDAEDAQKQAGTSYDPYGDDDEYGGYY